MSGYAGRRPGEVLAAVRAEDSRVKRARVAAVLGEMTAAGEPIGFRSVARRAGVSVQLVCSPGVREHVEAAKTASARAERRQVESGTRASAAGLAAELAMAREANKRLRAQCDALKARVARALGAQLEGRSEKDAAERINELVKASEVLAAERDAAVAKTGELQAALTEAEDERDASRQVVRQLMKENNRAQPQP